MFNKILVLLPLILIFILAHTKFVSELIMTTMTVPETHSKSTEDYVKKIDNQLQIYMAEMSKKLEGNDSKIDEVGKKLDVRWKGFSRARMAFWVVL